MLELGKKCEINKCHLHVYPSTWDEELYEDYMYLDKESEYFHFHKPICYEKLCEELSQYDYSILPVKNSAGIIENSYITKEKFIYAVSNKFFDSLEAGLPIIAWSPVKYSEMFEREGVLIRWHIEDIDFAVLRQYKNKCYTKIKQAQEKFSIDIKIVDLLRFYDSL